MKKQILPALIGLSLLAGCSDDDNDSVSQPNPTPPDATTPKTGTGAFDNVWGPDIQFLLEGPIFVYLGKGNITRQDNADQYQFRTPANAIIVDAEDVRKRFPKPFRDDIYNDGQITMLEVLMYISEIRDDFHVEMTWAEDLGTYRYAMSYDANGDGDFEDIDEGDYQNDPNWYMNYIPNEGQFRRDTLYDERGETTYGRLGLLHVQPRSGYYIQPLSPAMTARREYFQKQELERATKAKELYPDETVAIFDHIEVTIDLPAEGPGTGKGGETLVFENVVARPHNLRPDIFKKDAVITVADALLTLHDEGKLDIKYTYWGKLATEVDIQHFFLNEINGIRAHGDDGFLIHPINKEGKYDFTAAKLSTMLQGYGQPFFSHPMSFCDRDGNGIVDTSVDTNPFAHDPHFDRQAAQREIDQWCSRDDIDISDWWTHWNQHLFTDVWVQNYPGDTISVERYSMYQEFAEEQSRRVGGPNGDRFDYDYRWPMYDIDEAEHPLTEDHFGWGIADCGTCHSLEGVHSNGDMGTLGVNPKPVSIYDNVTEYPLQTGEEKVVAPYQCAQCHGSNGAPDGHGEIARCFWCHTEEFVPEQHGAFSSYTTKGELGVTGGNGGAAGRAPSAYGNKMFNPARPIDWVDVTDPQAVAALNDSLNDYAKDQGWRDPNSPAFKPHLADPVQRPNLIDLQVDIPGAKDFEGLHWTGFYGLYPDSLKTRSNNDWVTDPSYPDPYSCMTCHPNR